MYKFGILGLLLWKAFLIFEQIVSVYVCSRIICSLMKVTACQADLMIHPYIVKSLLYFTCIQSIHSSTYAHATERCVGSLTDGVCLAVSCVVFLVLNMWEQFVGGAHVSHVVCRVKQGSHHSYFYGCISLCYHFQQALVGPKLWKKNYSLVRCKRFMTMRLFMFKS